MIILRHDSLLSQDLFLIERVMLKVSETSYKSSLDKSLLNKPRGEVYGFIAGIFKRIGIYQTLSITTSDFLDLLMDIEKCYNDNPYHSFYHAVDVVMVLYHMLEKYDMKRYLNRFDLAMLMLAALCHDIGHPGRNNQFETSCKTKKALQYNNLSVLESHSSALTLALFEKHNILSHIDVKSEEMIQDEFKASIVQMILATDMTCHFSLKENIFILHDIIRQRCKPSCQKLVRQKCTSSTMDLRHNDLKLLFPGSQDPFLYFKQNYFISSVSTSVQGKHYTTASPPLVLNQQEKLMMCQILLHAADISNPCRPWPIFRNLSLLVSVEFFRQGEEELSLGLPVSSNMDPHKADLSAVNVGFIDLTVQPYFEALTVLFPKSKKMVTACKKNRENWLKKVPTTITEVLDDFGRNITSVNVALSGPIQSQVTTAAGTVVIPEHMLLESQKRNNNHEMLPLHRSVSFNHLSSQLPGLEEEEEEQVEAHIRKYPNQRRKSADTTIRQIYTKNRPFTITARRKSEETRRTVSLFN